MPAFTAYKSHFKGLSADKLHMLMTETNQHNILQERPASKAASKNQTDPSESSRSSVSSPWSRSSFTSAETYHRTSQLEPPFLGNGMSQQARQCRNSNGLRDVVKDSIHREVRLHMARNRNEEEKGLSTLKYIDSPRPLIQFKLTKNRVSILDGSSQNILVKDTPRFSYKRREMRPSSLMRLQEPPSQSLDGKEQSMKICGRQNYHFKDQHKQGRSCNFLNWKLEPESQGRTSGVVAKLMGLEVLPEPDTGRFSRINQNKQNRYNSSLKNADSEAAKPVVNIADYKKHCSSTSRSTSNALLKSHKKHTRSCAGSKKINEKQTADDRASSPSLRRGNSNPPLHNLKKNNIVRPLEMIRALEGHHSPISKSGDRPINHNLQKKKLGIDQQHHQAIPSTDSSKNAPHHSKGQKESGSPIRKPRPRLRIPKQPDSRTDQIVRSHERYATSLQSENNRSMLPFANADVTRKYELEKAKNASGQYTPKQKNSNPGVGEETSRPDPLDIVQEQPSPISVLDAVFRNDEPLSPVKKIPNALNDEEHLNSKEASWNSKDQSDFCHSKGLSPSLEDDPHLLLTKSKPEEFAMQETAGLCESRHKEQKYISEILSKSGILEDPESNLINTQLHPSRLPLHPEFFFALEQGEVRIEVPKDGLRYNRPCQTKGSEKFRRKHIFDTVNEILAQKILFEGMLKECIPLRVLQGKRAKGHMILQTVFFEIDRLQAHNSNCKLDDKDYSLKGIFWEDLMHREREWTALQGEIPGITLDVERLIFKDLIGEVISGERAASKARPHKHHRRLFST